MMSKIQVRGFLRLYHQFSNFASVLKYSKYRPEGMDDLEKAIKIDLQKDDEKCEEEEKKGEEEKEEEEIEGKKEDKQKLARLRWVFCCRCVEGDLKRRRKEWSWDHMKRSRKKCRSYVDLYIKKKKKTLNEKEEKTINRFEERMDYDLLMYCRLIGLNYLKEDRLYQEKTRKSFSIFL